MNMAEVCNTKRVKGYHCFQFCVLYGVELEFYIKFERNDNGIAFKNNDSK